MTNEEKIREILNCDRCKKIIALSGTKCNSPCDRFKNLIEMAQWKDKNPSIETIKKIVIYALKNTNIILSDDLEHEVDWELLIKKALQ